MKQRKLIILLALIGLSIPSIGFSSNEKFSIVEGSGLIDAILQWDADFSYPVDESVWLPQQWGHKYIVKAFGLEGYKLNRKSVLVVHGKHDVKGIGANRDTHHYIYHKDNKKVCILRFRLQSVPRHLTSRARVSLIGCHGFSMP